MTISHGSSTVEWARRVARTFGVSRPPVPIEGIVDSLGIEVFYWPLRGRVQEVVLERAIGISRSIQDNRRRRELMAHALAHWFMHRENGLAVASPIDNLRRGAQEQQAWTFAELLLVPPDWLSSQLYRESWEIADDCMVTVPFAARCQQLGLRVL